MEINILNDKMVKNIKSDPEKRQKIRDGGALFLVVETTGTKKWHLYATFRGKQKTYSFGVYPNVSLAEARKRRDSAKALLDQGIEPISPKKAKKQEAIGNLEEVDNRPCFADIAKQWYEANKSMWSSKHSLEVKKSLEKELFPIIGTMKMQDIKSFFIKTNIIDPIEKRGRFEKGSRVIQRAAAIFDFAIASGIIEDKNPIIPLKTVMQRKPKVKHRPAFLTIEEVRNVLTKVDEHPMHITTRCAIRFLALTVVRASNVNTAKWHEIDFNKNIWIIPADKMKNKTLFVVPLQTQAIQILQFMKNITGNSE
jgi:integrase